MSMISSRLADLDASEILASFISLIQSSLLIVYPEVGSDGKWLNILRSSKFFFAHRGSFGPVSTTRVDLIIIKMYISQSYLFGNGSF